VRTRQSGASHAQLLTDQPCAARAENNSEYLSETLALAEHSAIRTEHERPPSAGKLSERSAGETALQLCLKANGLLFAKLGVVFMFVYDGV